MNLKPLSSEVINNGKLESFSMSSNPSNCLASQFFMKFSGNDKKYPVQLDEPVVYASAYND